MGKNMWCDVMGHPVLAADVWALHLSVDLREYKIIVRTINAELRFAGPKCG